jgi:hypothetical protein
MVPALLNACNAVAVPQYQSLLASVAAGAMRQPFVVSRLSTKGAMDQNYSWMMMMNYLERQELEGRESEPHRFD